MLRKGATELSNAAENEQGGVGVKSVWGREMEAMNVRSALKQERRVCARLGRVGNGETESNVTGRRPLPWYGGNSTERGYCWTSTSPTALQTYSKLVEGAREVNPEDNLSTSVSLL